MGMGIGTLGDVVGLGSYAGTVLGLFVVELGGSVARLRTCAI